MAQGGRMALGLYPTPATRVGSDASPSPDPLTSYGKGAVGKRCSPFYSSAPANQAGIGRNWIPLTQGVTKLGVTVGDFKLSTSTAAETVAGTGDTITWEVWAEYPENTYTRITFGGGNNTGSTTNLTLLESDEVLLSTPYIPGTDLWIWLRAENTAGGIYFNGWRNVAKGEGFKVGTNPATIEAAPTTGISWTGNNTMPPLVVWSTEATVPAAAILGDSKNAGENDLPFSTTAPGYLRRGQLAHCFSDDQLFLNLSSGGSRAGNNPGSDWVNVWTVRKQVLKYFSHHKVALLYNDVCVDGASAATAKAAIEVVLADILAANTYARTTLITLPPRAGSTSGGYINLADQSASFNTGRMAHNDNVRAGTIVGNNNGYYEIGNLLDANPTPGHPDNGKWAMPAGTRDITDAAINASSTTLTSATANFTAADINKGVWVQGAGAAGGSLNRYIVSVTNSTTVVLNLSAGTTVSGANCTVCTPTPDGLHETPERYRVPANSGTIDIAAKLAA